MRHYEFISPPPSSEIRVSGSKESIPPDIDTPVTLKIIIAAAALSLAALFASNKTDDPDLTKKLRDLSAIVGVPAVGAFVYKYIMPLFKKTFKDEKDNTRGAID